jgi:hypothetical protein
MTIKDLTVKTFIGFADIIQAEHFETEVDREVSLLSCITGREESFFLNMELKEFNKWKREIDFVSLEGVKAQAHKYIKANGKVYAPIYNFTELTAGQFVDITHFVKEPEKIIENLPTILASICVPTKRTLLGRKKLPYMSVPHSEVSADMESAPIEEAYSIAVFFWNVWNGSLENIGDSLIKKILQKKKKEGKKLTEIEKAALLNILQTFGGGIVRRKKSQ